MRSRNHHRAATRRDGRRQGARLLLLVAAIATAAPSGTAAQADAPERIAVHAHEGVYRVAAAFSVPEAPAIVLAMLTDYEQIPRFMPDVTSSQVLERAGGRALVAQEANPRVLMFSRRVHLVLDVEERPEAIRFRDRCRKSFSHYEGAWQISETDDGGTAVTYELVMKPSFSVPGFAIRRLLRQDAARMIDRLETEIGSRAAAGRAVSAEAVQPFDPGTPAR